MKKIVIGMLGFVFLFAVYTLLAPLSTTSAQLYPPTSTPVPETCASNGGTCMDICVSPDVPLSGTCSNALYECCGPYVPPATATPVPATCASNGGTCMDACVSPEVPISGACTNALYECCGAYDPSEIACGTVLGDTCMSSCSVNGWTTSPYLCASGWECCRPDGCPSGSTQQPACIGNEIVVGTSGGQVCCSTPTTCTPDYCEVVAPTASCPSGTALDSGLSCSAGYTCCVPTSQHSCAKDLGCGVSGCVGTDTWVQYFSCPIDTPCSKADTNFCTLEGGACTFSASCTIGCHPTSCVLQCGLGGCPGGCGSVDDCGGVGCGTDGCTGGVPTAYCGDNSCNGSETCGTCAGDCGICTPEVGVCQTMFYCKTDPLDFGCKETGASTPYDSTTHISCTNPPNTCETNIGIWGEQPNAGVCYNTLASCQASCLSGTVRARLVEVASGATSCASSTYLSGSVGLSGYGYKSVSGGSYATWTVNPDTYTIYPVNPGGYSLAIACYDTGFGMTAPVGAGQTVTWNLGYTLGTPWFQAKEGDVYGASGTLYSPIPSAATLRYFSLDGAGGTPGIVTYGGDFDFDSEFTLTGGTYVSSAGWNVNESYPATDYYTVMYHRFGSPTDADYSAADTTISTANTLLPAPKNGSAYYVSGNLTIDAAWTIGASESKVFIVNGDLTINQRINITAGGFVAFIVNGDIHIDSLVGTTATSVTPVIEGVYITSTLGGIYTGASTAPASRRFVGKGMFIAGNIYPERDLDADSQNNAYAADLFLYNPQLLITMPDEMMNAPISWEEVAP